jgi:Transglycosylase SLT domain
LIPLLRAILVWGVVLGTIVTAHAHTQATPLPLNASANSGRYSILTQLRAHRAQTAEQAEVAAWSQDLTTSVAAYQARLQAEAEAAAAAKAEADRIAALNNHPPPPPDIAKIIYDAFSPLGPDAVVWADRIAYCESRYHPNSVNTDSGAAGLFQFMPGTWGGTPWASQSPFDPVANAQAAAWLYNRYGPGRWTCQ